MKTNNKGISLIVLVITVIVLSILASAVIISLSNTNIITNAQDAVDDTLTSQIKEVAMLAYADAMILGYSEEAQISQHVMDYLKNSGFTEAQLNDYEFNITTGGISVVEKLLSNQVTVGDYVVYEYTPGTASVTAAETGLQEYATANNDATVAVGQTFNSAQGSANEITKWRVLSIKNGVVKLVGDLPTGLVADNNAGKLGLTGANGYLNGPTLLNRICGALYSGSYGTAEALSIEDIMEAVGINEVGRWYYYDKTYTKIMIDSQTPITIADLESKPELGAIGGQRLVPGAASSTFSTQKVTAYSINHNDANANYDYASPWSNPVIKAIYPGSNSEIFWLADTCVSVDYDSTDLTKWTPRASYCMRHIHQDFAGTRWIYDSEGTMRVLYHAFRPVVTLNTDLKVAPEQVTLDDGTKAWVIR